VKKAGFPKWLFKEEPDHYSFADLERDGTTLWDGVTNNLARKNLRQVEVGDRVLYYHTGSERAIVGEMTVVEGPQPEPGSDDAKSVAVKVQAEDRWQLPLSLERIKADKGLKDWDLVRLGRLSVVPVSAEQWKLIEQLRKELTAEK
jgi:predicted RNA-binding protein with PUA-like domain